VAFGHYSLVAGLFYGIKPAVTAIVLQAAHRIGSRALRNGWLWAIAAAAFAAIFFLNTPFPLIVLMAGVLGALGGKFAPAYFSVGGGHGSAVKDYGPALIDDHTPAPSHAIFSTRRFVKILAFGLGLWMIVFGVLIGFFGWRGVLPQMAWFFTKAALLTFGGAYAVLPYVYQGAVDNYQWLTAPQMIDGLALGETTPGPLIMVVAFVGFVGGWTKQVFGPDALFLAGALAASIVTFFTFLPSFLFILLGGPAVESTRGDLRFTAPLTGVTAAVVGVILNLALFFAYHVLWPGGFEAKFEWLPGVIGLAAFIALFRFKIGVIPVLIACALAGLGLSLVGGVPVS